MHVSASQPTHREGRSGAIAVGRPSFQTLGVMSAYRNALHIKSDVSGDRLTLAKELLSTGQGVVVIDGALALRANGNEILCEVISGGQGADLSSEVADAKNLLLRSTISLLTTPGLDLQWNLVEDYGTGTQELWRAS